MTDRSPKSSSTFPQHQLSYVTKYGEGEGLPLNIIPFKDKFDNPDVVEVEKRKKLGIENGNDKEINEKQNKTERMS